MFNREEDRSQPDGISWARAAAIVGRLSVVAAVVRRLMTRSRRISTILLIAGSVVLLAGPLTPRQGDAAVAGSLDDLVGTKNGGKITGGVFLAGDYHPPEPLKVVKSRNFCGDTVPNETFLVGTNGGVRNAVVTLHPVDKPIRIEPGRVVLDNRACAFVPHVQVATLGSELILKNSDPILHTVHARLGKTTLFNVGLPQWRLVSKMLTKPGAVRIDCDVLHTWMSAAIVVVATPYYFVTGENGLFTIDGIPAGSYDIEVWHERLGIKRARISVSDRAPLSIEMFISTP